MWLKAGLRTAGRLTGHKLTFSLPAARVIPGSARHKRIHSIRISSPRRERAKTAPDMFCLRDALVSRCPVIDVVVEAPTPPARTYYVSDAKGPLESAAGGMHQRLTLCPAAQSEQERHFLDAPMLLSGRPVPGASPPCALPPVRLSTGLSTA